MVESNEVRRLVAGIEGELPGTIVDCVFDFGSCAKDETPDQSDVDLWVLVHSGDVLILDRTLQKHERYRATHDDFLGEYSGFQTLDVDTWGTLVLRLQPKMPFMLSCPIADIRWYLWQLANETDWQTFLYMVFAQAYYDPSRFLKQLQTFLWDVLPFHIGQDCGIVRTLIRLCEKEKELLRQDLHQIETQPTVDVPKHERPTWLRYAVECFRDSVTLLSLVTDGRPLFRRSDFLQFIESHFPEKLVFTERTYHYKCTLEGRAEFTEILTHRTSKRLEHLATLTCQITGLCQTILARVDQAIVEGNSKLRAVAANWREENRRAYVEFLDTYLGRTGHPTLHEK